MAADLGLWAARVLAEHGRAVAVVPPEDMDGARAVFDPLTGQLEIAADASEEELKSVEASLPELRDVEDAGQTAKLEEPGGRIVEIRAVRAARSLAERGRRLARARELLCR